MKRYLALFTATLLLVVNCIVYTPVKAVGTTVDFGEMFAEYLSLAELSTALTQGVEIDWSNFEFDENATNKEKAQALLNYYYSLLYNGVDFFLDISGNYDVISEDSAAISLQTASSLTPENIQDLRSQVASAVENYNNSNVWNHVYQKYNDKVIAAWNKYNSMYINDYLDLMNYSEQELPVPAPDATYFNDYYHYVPNTSRPNWATFSDNSYYLFSSSMGDNLFYGEFICVSGGALYINWDNISGYWTISCSGNPSSVYNDGNYLYSSIYNGTYQGPYTISFNLSDYTIQSWLNNRIRDQIKNVPNEINAILNYVAKIARNIPVYVNGTLYSALPIDRPVSINLPNSVIDNSTDDGKIVAHSIYYPDEVKIDGLVNIDLDVVRDSIIDAIAQGRSSITIDDVVADGAAVKVDGNTLTDADTKTIDASIPIEAAKADTLTVPISAVPGLPKLPPIIPPGGSGSSVPNGFSGMSVLARIINVTVQSVPQPLIMCFFGVIFGMVVLGIIKILHH